MNIVTENNLKQALYHLPGVRGLSVTPEFYVGFTRWIDGEIRKADDYFLRDYIMDGRNIQYMTDDEIIEKRVGDKFTYRGVEVRLAKEFQ